MVKPCAAPAPSPRRAFNGMHPLHVRRMKEAGYVIWLKASPETIYERVKNNRNRPLLKTGDPQQTIREMLEARHDLYDAACNLRIRTDDLTMEETCYGVTESARLAFAEK